MRLLLLVILLFPSIGFSNIEIISEKPRYITVTHRECEMKEVYVENGLSNSIIGGIIGAAIGSQIGGGSGKDIATVIGAITGTNVARTRSANRGRIEYREVCRDVETQVQKGKYVTMSYEGSTHTIVVNTD